MGRTHRATSRSEPTGPARPPPRRDRRASRCDLARLRRVPGRRAGAREAARRNAEQLNEVVRATGEQGALVRATADAAAEAGQGAALMAQAAEALNGFTRSAAGAAAEAGANLQTIDAALATLAARLADGEGPLAAMRASTSGVADFLLTLARLSRHAQLLGVNAQIEAARLAEAGSRFASWPKKSASCRVRRAIGRPT